ncbi:hypothetical protein [Salinivibrio sp. ES.052]|uniref:hypothetical protein n=1 Tax=Salinivibrio sp. ES.052 TaxID=1882823 RepID=UPI00092B359F|nr:hypothetical protein [Salinivibrio sp. ES.052]SIN79057.1 hypothetical protein SAMN05444724_0473 [Salinivibrio sp. ES.052]
MENKMIVAFVAGTLLTQVALAGSSTTMVDSNSSKPIEVDTKEFNAEQALAAQVDGPVTLTEISELHGYKGVNLDSNALKAGDQVYNEVTRTLGKVTGNITVLLEKGTIYELAESLNLNVTYFDETTKLGQLNASGQADIVTILEEIKSKPAVKSARIDILEEKNQPQ